MLYDKGWIFIPPPYSENSIGKGNGVADAVSLEFGRSSAVPTSCKSKVASKLLPSRMLKFPSNGLEESVVKVSYLEAFDTGH